ncbi:MAG: phosphate ABC transporter substrate-binding protein PstS [Candidatus Omnitrophica bacterium CG11_big_fil_rev_8_21_14_0_20_64_10]|nr:MAG: phosphate ABC transporter substrate-binding protein PstS [Candidatus Omnitrophica bacterium CG11_big_fil_rev_8_21_14_0_20_64_10]
MLKLNEMKRLGFLALTAVMLFAPEASARIMLVNGAGATFPYPIYSKWFSEYAKRDGSINFNYQSIGSGGGIKQLQAGTVDFGASDAPMKESEMADAKGKVFHFPSVMGGVVVTYNLPGAPKLNFSQANLSAIFMGKIKRWNNPMLAKDNPGVNLPDQPIAVVHRSDGSGTTYVFTDFLSNISKEWKSKVGTGKSVNWPVGLGGKGNEGVTGLVKQTPYSIGYVELGYATENKLPYGRVESKEGQFVDCTAQTVSRAAAGAVASMPEDFRVSIVNSPGADAYPIATFTWLLVYEKQESREVGQAIIDFLHWALTDGQAYAERLGYAPLPAEVVQMEKRAIAKIQLP